MTLSRVEHALGMMRIYLVECAAQNDWGDHRSEELAQTIVACIRQTTDEAGQIAPERDPRLVRDVLRRAIRFVNENLDTKLKWDEIATAIGMDPFTFGRGASRNSSPRRQPTILTKCRCAGSDLLSRQRIFRRDDHGCE